MDDRRNGCARLAAGSPKTTVGVRLSQPCLPSIDEQLAAGRQLIERAVASLEIRPDTDVETVLDMLYGPLFFRLLTGHQPLSPQLAEHLVQTLFDGVKTT